jgi:hypothetical protein
MRNTAHDDARLWRRPRRPKDKSLSDDSRSTKAPTAQEVCFETGVTLCLALGAALIVQLLLASL